MRRPVIAALSVASLVAVPLAGCGKSDEDKFAGDYKPLNAKLLKLGDELGASVNGAKGKSNSEVASDFSRLSKKFTTLRTDMEGLDPPDKLKGDSDKLSTALGAVEKDVSSISAAGKSGDARAARQSAQKLATDAQQVNTAQNKLAKATGAPAGAR